MLPYTVQLFNTYLPVIFIFSYKINPAKNSSFVWWYHEYSLVVICCVDYISRNILILIFAYILKHFIINPVHKFIYKVNLLVCDRHTYIIYLWQIKNNIFLLNEFLIISHFFVKQIAEIISRFRILIMTYRLKNQIFYFRLKNKLFLFKFCIVLLLWTLHYKLIRRPNRRINDWYQKNNCCN